MTMHLALCLQLPGMMVGIDQKDGKSGITHSTTNSGLRLKKIPFCPRAHDADHVRDVQRGRGSCGSPEKAQASARVDVPTARSKRRKTVHLRSRTGSSTRRAQEIWPNLLKDVNVQTIIDLDEEEEEPHSGRLLGLLEKQGVQWTPSRRGATGSWWRGTDGARSVAMRDSHMDRAGEVSCQSVGDLVSGLGGGSKGKAREGCHLPT